MLRINNYKVAKYMRLSRDDGDDRESESIENQRDILDSYISEHEELEAVEEYVDDGYTGTNFNRPRIQKDVTRYRRWKNRLYYNKRLIKIWKRSHRYRLLFRKIFANKQH